MSPSQDSVSIVIPVYNSKIFLKESLESVLNQTHKNIEIIVIDDGSTDNSLKILEDFSEKITVISQENQGLAASLNTGLEHSSGRWFKWFSPDDILFPHAIENLVFKAKHLPENSVIYSNWDIIDEFNKKLRSFTETNFNDLTVEDFNVRLLDGQLINVNTSLIPISLFTKGLKIQEIVDPVLIDYDLFLQAGILFQTKFYLINESLIAFRVHSEQLSHQNIVKNLENLSQIHENVLSKLDENKKLFYIKKLELYKKTKPLSKKTMSFGLEVIKKTLPNTITNKLLIYYLNKIRRTR